MSRLNIKVTAVVAGIALILIAFFGLIIYTPFPFVSVQRRVSLVDSASPVGMMILHGDSDAAIKNAIVRSGKADKIVGMYGTPLCYAASYHRLSLAKWLLEKKHARPNGTYVFDPLEEAVAKKDVEMVALLLKYGADPTHKASDGITPMWTANYSNAKPEIMAMLEKSKPKKKQSPGGRKQGTAKRDITD